MIKHIIQATITWFEQQAYGVCAWLGKKMGMRSNTIRMYFIYLSFFTFGSPIIVYFILAFLLEHKQYFGFKRKYKRPSIWDLE